MPDAKFPVHLRDLPHPTTQRVINVASTDGLTAYRIERMDDGTFDVLVDAE
jgi:hypothetical protein